MRCGCAVIASSSGRSLAAITIDRRCNVLYDLIVHECPPRAVSVSLTGLGVFALLS